MVSTYAVKSGRDFIQLWEEQLLPKRGMHREQHHDNPLHEIPHRELVVAFQALKHRHGNVTGMCLVEVKETSGCLKKKRDKDVNSWCQVFIKGGTVKSVTVLKVNGQY